MGRTSATAPAYERGEEQRPGGQHDRDSCRTFELGVGDADDRRPDAERE